MQSDRRRFLFLLPAVATAAALVLAGAARAGAARIRKIAAGPAQQLDLTPRREGA